MVPAFTLLAHFLLISATLVPPSFGFQALSANAAGAVRDEVNSTRLNTVTGTFTVPPVNGWSNSTGASAWVGIDGDTCGASLSTGVDFAVDGYKAWYWWYDGPYSYPDTITISAGDIITASVTVLNSTSGNVTIVNLSNGMSASTTAYSGGGRKRVCGQNAEWLVGLLAWHGPDNSSLADFGTLTLTNASTSDTSGKIYYPDEAQMIVNILERNHQITNVSTNGSSVSITYVYTLN